MRRFLAFGKEEEGDAMEDTGGSSSPPPIVSFNHLLSFLFSLKGGNCTAGISPVILTFFHAIFLAIYAITLNKCTLEQTFVGPMANASPGEKEEERGRIHSAG